MVKVRYFFAAILCLVSLHAYGQPIEKYQRVYFSNTAPGELENDLVKKFPAKITFSSESGIPYGGVYVRIYNASGLTVFKKLCEKPWLFLKLPEGDYYVVAVDRNKLTKIKPFHVRREGKRQAVVKLNWPKDVIGY